MVVCTCSCCREGKSASLSFFGARFVPRLRLPRSEEWTNHQPQSGKRRGVCNYSKESWGKGKPGLLTLWLTSSPGRLLSPPWPVAGFVDTFLCFRKTSMRHSFYYLCPRERTFLYDDLKPSKLPAASCLVSSMSTRSTHTETRNCQFEFAPLPPASSVVRHPTLEIKQLHYIFLFMSLERRDSR